MLGLVKHIPIAFITALILLVGQPTAPGVSAESPVASGHSGIMASKLVINIPSRTLWVYSGDKIVRYFPVGVGRPGYMTPVGKYKVIRKVVDPGWENPYLPKGQVRLAPGEDNPLGTRWIGFHQNKGGEYGMHGTDNPASVGKFSSHGCVRLKVKDAEALFDMVDVGTPVEVVYEPVLIRKKDNTVRIIVFSDRFQRGMPAPENIKADILKQYPNAELDFESLKSALRQPTERPVDVAQVTDILTAGSSQKQPLIEPEDIPALNPVDSIQSGHSQL